MRSWIDVSSLSHFPIQNLPYGVFSYGSVRQPRCGVAIGEHVLDLSALHDAGLLTGLGFDTNIFAQPSLNDFMSLTKSTWLNARARITDLLSSGSGSDNRLRVNEALRKVALIPMKDVQMHMPAVIGDYTDFYSSREHATNVGIMFRGKDNALQPNWLHLPVGYHGRASSVVLSGTDVVRPCGQLQIDKDDPSKGSVYGPCRLLDFELEMAFFVGGPANAMGSALTIAEAEDRIFGVVLMNDWSARDIQAWEYVPLGPFTAKNFATSISPWLVTPQALEEFRCSTSAGDAQSDPCPLPYLVDPNYSRSAYDVRLQVAIRPEGDAEASVISTTNLKYMYWNMKQQLVHHSVTGCPMKAGDLLGTGTISGPTEQSLGSMLELSWRGAREITLDKSSSGDKRKFLKDGDSVIMSGYAESETGGYRVGFGLVEGRVLPAGSAPVSTASAATASTARYGDFKLYGYWRSSCSWRVRCALGLKGVQYEYIPVDLSRLVGNTDVTLPAEFLKLNPMEQVPLLQFTDSYSGTTEYLTQSLPIIEFIDEVFSGAESTGLSINLLPTDLLLRARVRQISEIVNSGIQPIHNIRNLRQIKTAVLISSDSEMAVDSSGFARDGIIRGLTTLEALVYSLRVGKTGEVFAAGTAGPTMADLCIPPLLYSAGRFGIDTKMFPSLVAVDALCGAIDAFASAVPERQIDAPQV